MLPTVIEPLRLEWSNAQAAAGTLASEGKTDEAVAELLRFHHRLCTVRVLDPACGSGNFLYVTLEHLKRLEGEVLNALDELGHRQTGLALDGTRADARGGETVDPHNLLGIELNPRAAAIAEVVLWIGYLQWHFRTRGDVNPPAPVIRDFQNIENRDAVLAYDRVEYVTDEHGVPVSRWDGETMKVSPVTGEKVPDETARKPLERYVNPRKATWPEADFVVGNPPFIGNKRMRAALGDGYVEALRSAWLEVPESADFVMYWWHYAAQLTRRGALERFGFITTNSIRQSFNRRVLEPHLADKKQPLSLVFAIPDHPWVDTADGAAVRIAMTAATSGKQTGSLRLIANESPGNDGDVVIDIRATQGTIHSDLRVGADIGTARPLSANSFVASRGVTLVGKGFVIRPEQTQNVIDAGAHLKRFVTGRALAQSSEDMSVLDFFGLDEQELRRRSPAAYQWLFDRVRPERLQNNRESYRKQWWVFAEPRSRFRKASANLRRIILTPRTAKHRFFLFAESSVQFESEIVGIALDDASALGVLSSSAHVVWAVASGGTLEDRPRYQDGACFSPFPFPDLQAADKFSGPIGVAVVNADGSAGKTQSFGEYPSDRIRTLAEQLDAHRKRQQAAHPGLTLTGMYNVLEKLRSGEPLTPKERVIHEQGLVSVLRQLHDELDEAVLHAYGWGDLLPLLRVAHGNQAPAEGSTREDAKRAFDEAVLERLVALNAERAAEEARGHVRWLRPEFQNPAASGRTPEQAGLVPDAVDAGEGDEGDAAAAVPVAAAKPAPWPKDPVEQVRAVADVLASSPVPLDAEGIAARFSARGPWKKRLPQLLAMLVALGRAREQDGRFEAA
ncbi:class I SAM-dependent DNA methyltransferase [Pseudoxanthomonas suwonensis]